MLRLGERLETLEDLQKQLVTEVMEMKADLREYKESVEAFEENRKKVASDLGELETLFARRGYKL